MTNKMTEEHKEFLHDKSEIQLEHIAGCQVCFDHFLFGTGEVCEEYPTRHRIKKSEFNTIVDSLPKEEWLTARVNAVAEALAAKFDDELLLDAYNLDEVRIVPDIDWKEEEN